MELMKGYKQTELGVIPDNWKLLSIDQIFEFHSTSNYSKSQMLEDGEIGCFHYGLIHSIPNFNYDIRNGVRYFVTEKQAKYEFIKDGDIVMVDASEDLSGVNKSIEVSGVQDKLFISGLHTYLLRDKGYYVGGFRGLVLNSYQSKSQFYRLAVGMKVFGVSKKQLKTVILPVPPQKEQIAIAAALSDADAYITNLEKLIEKKKAIKQGVMQELLKPKEDWILKKIREICKFQNGTALESLFNNSDGYKVISIGNYSEEAKFKNTNTFISFSNCEIIKKYLLKKGELALLMNDKTAVGTIIGRVLLVSEDDQFVFNQRTMRLSPHSTNVDSGFLYHLINSNLVHKKFVKLAKPGTQIYLNTQDILDFELSIPNSINEQKRLSEILSEIDLEINGLELKLKKTIEIKQGMMQNLLTGKIRLL